jgi:hypothetical protein
MSRPLLASFLACAVQASALAQGSIVAWGGDPIFHIMNAPTGTNFIQVSTGNSHSVALRSDGSIVSWGANDFAQVSGTPQGTGFIQVEAGLFHSLALGANGSIVAWGWDSKGQVSNAPMGGGHTQLAAGLFHSLALRSDGSIAAWGISDGSQGDGCQVACAPTGVGYNILAAGELWSLASGIPASTTWGLGAPTPPGVSFVAHAAVGASHGLLTNSVGGILSWGSDSSGQVSNTPTGFGFSQVAAGSQHSLALHQNGRIEAWGGDWALQVSGAPSGPGFFQIGACGTQSVALRHNNFGSSYCSGDSPTSGCPCGAHGGTGEGCLNTTTTTGAKLTASGEAAITGDSFLLFAEGIPGKKPGLILRGANQLNGGLGNPVGDGLLCVGGQSARSQVQVTSAGTTAFTDFNGSPFGQSSYGVGVPTNYQFWYRDTGNTCSGSGFNFSNAWTTTWLP